MKTPKDLHINLIAFLSVLPLLLIGPRLLADETKTPDGDELTPAAARTAIDEMYKRWGRARIGLDTKEMETILAPDFYVSLYGQKISREKFIHDISQKRADVRLTRFDTDILTVRRTENEWTVVISEKIELTSAGSATASHKVCSHWVTRDGWRKTGDKWQATFSEAIGHENWPPNTTPPVKGW